MIRKFCDICDQLLDSDYVKMDLKVETCSNAYVSTDNHKLLYCLKCGEKKLKDLRIG